MICPFLETHFLQFVIVKVVYEDKFDEPVEFERTEWPEDTTPSFAIFHGIATNPPGSSGPIPLGTNDLR